MIMKNSSLPKEAKIYKIQFTKLILTLAITVIIFCSIGIAFSIYQIVQRGVHGFGEFLKYPFLILVSIFCIVIVVSILVKSQYLIDERYLTSQYGLIKSRYDIKNITSVILDTEKYKLTIYCQEEFFIIAVNKEWNEAFVRDLLAVNPNIDYSFTFSDK